MPRPSRPPGHTKPASMPLHASPTLPLMISLLLLLSSPHASLLATAQQLVTAPQTYEMRLGSTVQLPCVVSDEVDMEDRVVVWKRSDGTLLTIDDGVEVSDNRISVVRDHDRSYTLQVVQLEPYDTADYTCSVTSDPPLEVTHKLLVHVPPSAKLNSQSPLQVKVGEEVLVRCSASGNPQPILHWRRLSAEKASLHLPPGSTTHHGQLRIERVREEDSGTYECRASNGVGQESTVALELRVRVPGNGHGAKHGGNGDRPTSAGSDGSGEVKSMPWAETDRLYIPTRIGDSVNLSCRYNGNPAPDVDWFFSGFKINTQSDTKFKSSTVYASRPHDNQSVSTFSIPSLQEDHFGDYTCKVWNELGSADQTIHLSGRPGPPMLVVRGSRLSWTVESMSPVSEYKLLYREPHEDVWAHHKELKSSREDQGGNVWEHSVQLDFLRPNTVYELQLQAKNTLGYGSLARNYVTYDPSGGSGDSGKSTATTSQHKSASGYLRPLCTLILPAILLAVLFS